MANENNGGGAIELAKAYVQILPSTKGIEGELNKAMGSAGTEAGKAGGNGIASGLSKAGAAIGKAAMAGLTAASGAVTALAKNAVDSYAEYEQLAGGVETLFQSSSDTVKKYADEAFATAGLSANAYMETVTGFSAALIQATGRGEQQDIDQLKAELDEGLKDAKRGYEDQYDEAKKAWDDRIKLAQKAKASNLDALKAQRDEELKALKRSNEDQLEALKQANKDRIAAAEEANNSSVTTEESLARAAEAANRAVIDMSDNANKMGTSMESIQNAYQGFAKQNYTMLDNLKLGYGGTKEEMQRLISDAAKMTDAQQELGLTVDANSMSFDNIVNAISVVQKSMGIAGTTSAEAAHTIEGSMGATKAAWQNLITAIGKGEGISESVDSLMTSLFGGEGGGGLLENLLPRVTTVMKGIGDFITKAAPIIAPKVGALVKDILPTLLKTAISMLKETLPVLIQTVVDMAPIFIDGVITLISTIIEQLPALIQPLLDALPVLIPQLIDGIVQMFVMLCYHIRDIIGPIIDALPDIINSITDALISNLPMIIAGIILLIGGIIAELPNLLVGLWDTFTHFWSEVWNQWLGPVCAAVGEWFGEVWNSIVGVFEGIGQWFSDIFSGAWEGIKTAWSAVTEWFAGLWEGIKAGAKAALNGIIKFANVMIDGLNAMLWPIRKLIETVAKVLGKDWTMDNIKIPNIPELAEGGILKRGQVGLLEGTGAEAVVPLEKNTEWIHRVASEINTTNSDSYTDTDEIVAAIRNMKLWLDGRAIVGGITDQMDKSLGNRSTMIGRGVATA